MGRTRQPGGEPSAAHDQLPDAAIRDLLDELRTARLRLGADLSAAAGALDADAPEVARDILAGDLADVAAFRATAIARLAGEADQPAPPPQRATRPRRSRALLALPAVPLLGGLAMSAAAALGGAASTGTAVVSGHSQHPTHKTVVAAPRPTASQLPAAAHSTLNRLEKVVTQHPQASQVIRVATDLHRQLTTIIATSADDPLRLDVVKQLLSVEQKVLEGNRAPGATLALAESRQVTQLLNKTTAPLGPVLHSSTSTSPTATTHAPHQNATHHRTTKSLRHHSSSSVHRHNSTRHKHPTDTSTPSPTPSSPVFGNGLFNTVL